MTPVTALHASGLVCIEVSGYIGCRRQMCAAAMVNGGADLSTCTSVSVIAIAVVSDYIHCASVGARPGVVMSG